ncbi:hypothetical protein FQN54_003092, partial [Arachnomyces sp. PD_36]
MIIDHFIKNNNSLKDITHNFDSRKNNLKHVSNDISELKKILEDFSRNRKDSRDFKFESVILIKSVISTESVFALTNAIFASVARAMNVLDLVMT